MLRPFVHAPIHGLDRIALTARWMCLSVLPLLAALAGRLSTEVILILGAWGIFALFLSLSWGQTPRPTWADSVGIIADIVFGVICVVLSGGPASPLWGGLVIGGVTAGLAYGRIAGVAAGGMAGLVASTALVAVGQGSPLPLIPGTLYSALLLGSMVGMGKLIDRVRAEAPPEAPRAVPAPAVPSTATNQRPQDLKILRMAAELTATLNYERVLELALDLSTSAMASSNGQDERLVSALLLFHEGRLEVVSARRLPAADQRFRLPGESGIIGQALNRAEPVLTDTPSQDPELQRMVSMHTCRTALCIPLVAGLEAYGVLLFGHPETGYFSADRVEILGAIGHQAMIALQNARLYRDLEQEKERITEIQEEARKKLARDLHDGPTQSIAAIAMRVNFARRLMERDAKAASAELFKVEDLARRTTKEIRHMLFTLRPLILESQGLVAALQQLADKMRETHGQQVIVEAERGVADDLEVGKQGVVFYIAEEAINNARKHAEAEHIWVRLKRSGELFILEVQDDGVGFNVGAVDANYEQRGSLGMVNMRERTELVNGLLRIDSAEGKGTHIRVYVPLTVESAEKLQRPGFVP